MEVDETSAVEKKDSNTSIVSNINKLEIASQDSEVKEASLQKIDSSSSELSDSRSSDSSSSSEQKQEDDQPVKRRRRRRRRRKRKAVAAYIPDEPFTKRYKKTFVEISMKPKLHVKFDEESGDIVSYQNNYKPRVISALSKNLSVTETFNDKLAESKEDVPELPQEVTVEHPVVSLKPRIIKAIGT